ncbi:transcription factor PIF3 [Spatholobus suberectus]|nr:transcription factor PIF3 [Spatholobus suberectus]
MASLHSNVDSATSLQQSNHKKRRKVTHHTSLTLLPWTSQTEHRIYSSNLLHALRRNRPPPSAPLAGREVRASADRVLAVAAKGRTRWSRAILASPLGRWKQRQHKKVKKSANGAMKKSTPEIRRRLPAVQNKARVLGRLIPGCRNVSFPKLLEEAVDYISALEMQVRAMTALADLISGGAPPPAPLRLS